MAGADLGGLGDVFEGQAEALARASQRRADIDGGIEREPRTLHQRDLSTGRLFHERARIERHDAYDPQLGTNDSLDQALSPIGAEVGHAMASQVKASLWISIKPRESN